jgi:type IV secretion system protein VirD4
MSRSTRSKWRFRAGVLGVVFVFAGLGTGNTAAALRCLLIGGVLLAAVAAGVQGRTGSAGAMLRMSRRSRRRHGVASWWTILRSASRFAVRRKMRVLRPSLQYLGFWRRFAVPTLEVATPLARVGLLQVWSPIEDVTLRVGGPRVGKSGELAGRILDAPGAVIATSTRTDLIGSTALLRQQTGPVSVFNPCGLGRLESTIVFDPLSGCEDPKTAVERATDLLSGTSGSGTGSTAEREFWQGQAVRVLSALMHAAALSGASMRHVQRWVASPDTYAGDVQRALRSSPQEAIGTDVLQFLNTNERTQTSITATIMPALAWLNDATAATAAGQDRPAPAPTSARRLVAVDATNTEVLQPVADDPWLETATPASVPVPSVVRAGFDVAQLLAERGTVYLLGAEDGQVAPLVCALTGHIARTARQLASEMPSGRLDPPLTLALDEAALICPIPLDSWTADMGGRNITIHIAVQSRAQLRQRWGDVGAAAILNNAATLLIFGGARDVDDLSAFSVLTGHREDMVPTRDAAGHLVSSTPQRVPVLSEADFAQLPPGRVVIIRRGMPPAVGSVQMAWKRHDVRAATRRVHRAERARVRAVVRRKRTAAWARRRAWVAAGAGQLARAFAAGIAAAAAGIERTEAAWIQHEARRAVKHTTSGSTGSSGTSDRVTASAGAGEVGGGRDA